MNDLPVSVTGVDIKMYANDTSLFRAFKTINDLQEKLIHAFSRVCELLKHNKLSLNAVKTEFMIMGTLRNLTNWIVIQMLHHTNCMSVVLRSEE